MTRPISTIASVGIFLGCLADPISAQHVALVGGMLIDGYEAPPVHNATVLIEGNRIVAVGPSSQIEIPAGAEVIDTRGMTMLPGLIDLHVHTMFLGHGEYAEWFPFFTREKEEMMEIAARQLLMAGVTTAVDLGAPIEIIRVRDRIDRGEVPGPRMLVSGPWIAGRRWGSFPDYFQHVVSTPEEAARRTYELADADVDVIKTWAGMSEDMLRAVVEAAHERGIQVHSHLYSPDELWNAIRAGTDVIQHAGSAGNPPYSDELVQEIAHRGIPVVQTIAHRPWVYQATVEFPERLQDRRLVETLPPELYEEFQRSFQDFRRLSYFRTTPLQIRKSQLSAGQFIEANAVMGMGTDSGSPLNFHTESAWREISALVDSGMTPIQAISAATKTGAEIIRRGNDLGTIEPGKLADIIVVRGNPLFDINVLGYVEHVVKDGRIYR
ncbi:MAG: amidohydrolase family protein [Longimicrobiales bacterium]|nr:amidohydrolase family protein [Longimicrobiales bacterium]